MDGLHYSIREKYSCCFVGPGRLLLTIPVLLYVSVTNKLRLLLLFPGRSDALKLWSLVMSYGLLYSDRNSIHTVYLGCG